MVLSSWQRASARERPLASVYFLTIRVCSQTLFLFSSLLRVFNRSIRYIVMNISIVKISESLDYIALIRSESDTQHTARSSSERETSVGL